MKKRMFITTIVMMLVLAVALTTSSLAWFSSANTFVTADAATFKASAASGSNVNIKISRSTSGWDNSIELKDGSGRAMQGIIPQDPLIATKDNAVFTWNPTMKFNQAKIRETGTETLFVVDYDAIGKDFAQSETIGTANKVNDYVTSYDDETNGVVKNTQNNPFYYDEFYIKNADSLTTINSLSFDVLGSMTTIAVDTPADAAAEVGDKASRGYAAFILFNAVNVAVSSPVPANALENANKTVVEFATQSPTEAQVKENSAGAGYTAWVPFAAFSIVMNQKPSGQESTNPAWQFANLDERGSTEFTYNGTNVDDLKVQAWDGYSGNGNGFTLTQASLRGLNNKTNYVNSEYVDVTTDATRDSTTTWSMAAGTVYRVAFYFWLDGYSMTSETDTTVAKDISIRVTAAQ